MSNILIIVFDVSFVQAAARYLPLFENLILKQPNASDSNFHIFVSGSSQGKSTNFSHFFNNYFYDRVSLSPKPSFLAEGLVNLLSILSYDSKPISLSQGAIDICLRSIMISLFKVN